MKSRSCLLRGIHASSLKFCYHNNLYVSQEKLNSPLVILLSYVETEHNVACVMSL